MSRFRVVRGPLRSALFSSVLLGPMLAGITVAPVLAQTAAGSLIGIVTDPGGNLVPRATVTIRSAATNAVRKVTTNASGEYSVLSLAPGAYAVTVDAAGFGRNELRVNVPVGETVNGDVHLAVGTASSSVTVTSSSLNPVNTVEAIVQDVIGPKEIDALPLNGRNFLDLAQLNPGVQIQDGGNLDPTKQGFVGVSLQGRTGRSTRVEVDGVDITDDTVGTTTMNLSQDSIQEFQTAQSTLDPASSVTTAGAVNVITRAGANQVHGEGFYLFRNDATAAKLSAQKSPFDRSQTGFRLGGPFLRDRLFWFLNYEHTLQHGTTLAAPAAQFSQFAASFSTPFHESLTTERLDWNVSQNWRAFYGFHFDQLNVITGFGGVSLSPYANRNLNAVHTVGLDGTTGLFSHSLRFGTMRFRNFIVDARHQVPGLPQAFPDSTEAGITIGNDPFCYLGTGALCLGPNYLAPQFTLQRNVQLRYDGSRLLGTHTVRYGVNFTNLPEATFGSFAKNGPLLNSGIGATEVNYAQANNTFGGGAANPLNFPLELVVFGNGLGYSSEKSGLGQKFGAFPGKRLELYIADTWRARSNVSVTAALRYNHLTGRTSSDAPALPALEPVLPGASHAVHQPNMDFGPQLGVAWDPFKDGKTSVRAGVGLYYDDYLVESSLFDRPLRIPGGLANVTPVVTGGTLPGTSTDLTSYFGQPIGSAVSQIVAAQNAYQQANAQGAASFNPHGTPGLEDPNVDDFNTFIGVLTPKFKTPRSVSFNLGVQRNITKSLFVSADYVRNVNTHAPLNHDVNLVGAVKTLNTANAQTAIQNTLAACGAASIDEAIASCPGLHATGQGATIIDFASNGLGSPASGLLGQFVAPQSGYAFAGVDTNLGQIVVNDTIGRSEYNGLQVRVNQTIASPAPGVQSVSWLANYSFSRFTSTTPDQDTVYAQNARDNLNPTKYRGGIALDRTSMISFGGTFTFKGGLQLSPIAHVYSALPITLSLPAQCNCPAEIFQTDLTGDGTGGDVLPGTNIGSFGRQVKLHDLNRVLSGYNQKYAGTLTPAGSALVSAGLMTGAQLQALGGVAPGVQLAPRGQVGIDNYIADDLRVSWPFKPGRLFGHGESITIEPIVDVFNVVNKANFDPPVGTNNGPLRGVLDGAPGSINGTTYFQQTNRYGLGSGVFSQGIPRALQFGARLEF